MPLGTDKVCLIGVPIDLGAGRRGVDMGPSAIRTADIEQKLVSLGFDVEDCGDCAVRIPETEAIGHDNLRFKEPIIKTCVVVMGSVQSALERGRLPLVIGGDHSLAIGSVAASAVFLAERKQKLGVIWLDAHADFNTPETTPSGNIHGMSLAASAGLGDPDLVNLGGISPKVTPANIAVVGARDLDPRERETLKQTAVTVFTMRDIDERGMRSVMEDAIAVAGDGTDGTHISFDLDVLDPLVAPGTGTPVRGGISYREGHLAMETLSDMANIVSIDMVEVNPVLDLQNQTAMLGVELVQSLLGKRIF